MATVTKGVFFMGKAGATTERDADGVFRLVLRVLDRQGPHKVEGYVVTWAGQEAAAWWQEHCGIGPGTPLELELLNPRSLQGMRAPEIHATVLRCTRAPVAPSWQAASDKAAPTHAARAA